MEKLVQSYIGMRPAIKAVIIFLITVAVTAILFFSIAFYMKSRAIELMQPYGLADSRINQYLDELKKPALLSGEYFRMLKLEKNVMNIRKQQHYQLSIIFFKNWYGILVVSMILSCLGGIILFILINKGWSNAGITLQALFLSIVICVSFFGLFPRVFQQEKNFTENMVAYMNYSKAEMDVARQLSFLSDPSFAVVKDSTGAQKIDTLKYYKVADTMVLLNANRINSMMNYVLTIDAREIKSIQDIAKILSVSQTNMVDSTGKAR